jgi:integral membrane protein (TIGR01906 family)
MEFSNFWNAAGRIAFIVLIPVVMLLTAVRLLLTDAFINFEYNMPGFPPDSFGLSMEDRLRWAPVALDYLLNDEGIEFLGELKFEDGGSLYNQRELRHMADVKQLTKTALRTWQVGLLILGALGAAVIITQGSQRLLEHLNDASRLTLIIMGVLALGVIVAFSVLFVGFHRIFFEGSTWLFPTSDTLIRLFPQRFWRDAFILLSLGTALPSGAIYLISRLLLARLPSS